MATTDLALTMSAEANIVSLGLTGLYNVVRLLSEDSSVTLEDFSPYYLAVSIEAESTMFPVLAVDGQIAADVQRPSVGEFIQLFQLDLTDLGGEVYYFVSSIWEDNQIVFGGHTYIPLPILAEGFEVSGRGAIPQPTITLANVKKLPGQLAKTYNNLLGAKVSRLRTFRKYLDNGSAPDAFSYFRPDIFFVNRMKKMNKRLVEWELASPMDQEGRQLPKRVVLRDICRWRYRVYTGTGPDGFDYTKATCPYTGDTYFTKNGLATSNPALDQCSKRLADGCEARYGEGSELPFGGFPGVARLRTT